jgi:hypothetical protein
MSQRFRYSGILAAALAILFGTLSFASADEPEQVDVRISADLKEDGTIHLDFQQFLGDEWVTTEITGWTATVPALGVANPTWTSDQFTMTVMPNTIEVTNFGLSDPVMSPPVMPSDWELPRRATSGTRYSFQYTLDPEDGFAYISRDLSLSEGRAPGTNTENIVRFFMGCRASGSRFLGFLTDVVPGDTGEYEVVWWTERLRPRAGYWSSRAVQSDDFFAADSPYASGMIEELRDATWLYVTIWGEESWRSAKLHITRLFDTPAQEMIDYCGQSSENSDVGTTGG